MASGLRCATTRSMRGSKDAWARVAWVCAAVLCVGCGGATVTPQARADAQKIWDERCTNCHGPRGLGDGPGALTLPVRPRALADSVWQASVSDEHIAAVIVDGGESVGLDGMMAANPDLKAKPAVLRALVEHVRSLTP